MDAEHRMRQGNEGTAGVRADFVTLECGHSMDPFVGTLIVIVDAVEPWRIQKCFLNFVRVAQHADMATIPVV